MGLEINTQGGLFLAPRKILCFSLQLFSLLVMTSLSGTGPKAAPVWEVCLHTCRSSLSRAEEDTVKKYDQKPKPHNFKTV